LTGATRPPSDQDRSVNKEIVMGSLPPLDYRVFTVTRSGLGRNLPAGYEPLMWVANSATLISGERDAVLVDTFLTNEQNAELVDQSRPPART
jgi:hypothetical protein